MTAAISPVFRMDFQPTGLKGTALWLSSTKTAEAAETFQRVVTFWLQVCVHSMGVSKNRGTPKWMVYNGKPY